MSNIDEVTPTARTYRSTADRRREIVDAAIHSLATHGYAGTSFARIRDVAELSSTRMISYHFADKAALMQAIVDSVIGDAAAVMVPAMEAEATMRGKLSGYIRSNLEFLASNRAPARAVIEIISNAPRQDNELREDTSAVLLSLLLAQGQEAGEFREFEPACMARSIRATIDAFAINMPEREEAVAAAIDEIIALYDRATRPEGTTQ
jgi:AcrR family transcriptional regulator